MTSAASLPSTAWTNALLTRPSLRSGPRYHIGKGAASIRCVSEFERGFGLAQAKRELGPLLLAGARVDEPQQQRAGGSGAGAGPPRTSNTRDEPATRTFARDCATPTPSRVSISSPAASRSSASDSAVVAVEVGEAPWRRLEPEVAQSNRHRLRCARRCERAAAGPGIFRAESHWPAPRRAPVPQGGSGEPRRATALRRCRATARQAP